jgi:hypothetical protein
VSALRGWGTAAAPGRCGLGDRTGPTTEQQLPSWVTADIDLGTPSVARVYDFLLGGMHNFAVDREMGRRLEYEVPGTIRAVRANRAFLRRAARYCARLGIDQYLDIGSGIPTEGNVHEVVRDELSEARVVYVDIDPIAVLHGRALLAEDPNCAMVHADLREPELILAAPETRNLIDFERPTAVLMVSILEVFPDSDRPAELIARLTASTVSGSHLVISHFGRNYGNPDQVRTALEAAARTGTPARCREPAELLALLGAFLPVPPGVVAIHQWQPDQQPRTGTDRSHGYAVVGRKP